MWWTFPDLIRDGERSIKIVEGQPDVTGEGRFTSLQMDLCPLKQSLSYKHATPALLIICLRSVTETQSFHGSNSKYRTLRLNRSSDLVCVLWQVGWTCCSEGAEERRWLCRGGTRWTGSSAMCQWPVACVSPLLLFYLLFRVCQYAHTNPPVLLLPTFFPCFCPASHLLFVQAGGPVARHPTSRRIVQLLDEFKLAGVNGVRILFWDCYFLGKQFKPDTKPEELSPLMCAGMPEQATKYESRRR